MSKSNKNWYWLKLVDDFFDQREIKKLRMLAGGDTYTIIYLQLQLLSLKNSGMIYFEKTENDIYEQLHFEIDEKIEDIKMTILYLKQNNLIEIYEEDLEFVKTKELIGVTTSGALRVARHRARKKQQEIEMNPEKTLHCNTVVTASNVEIEKEIELEIEIERELEEDIELKSPPTLPQIQFLFTKLNLKSDPNKFFNHHNSKQWIRNNGEAITLENLEAAAIYWESQEEKFNPNKSNFTNNNGQVYDTSQYEV